MYWDFAEPLSGDAIFCCGNGLHINVKNIFELMPQVFPLANLSKGLISSATIEDITTFNSSNISKTSLNLIFKRS